MKIGETVKFGNTSGVVVAVRGEGDGQRGDLHLEGEPEGSVQVHDVLLSRAHEIAPPPATVEREPPAAIKPLAIKRRP
jgi:hypothetical protein